MEKHKQVMIIGGGLSGLSLAYFLSKKKISYQILEASSRFGGRIQTISGKLETPMELGATWFSDLHQALMGLLDELEIGKYPQYSKGISLFQTKSFEPPQSFNVPESETPSYRIVGGTQQLIQKLVGLLDPKSIQLNKKVTGIEELGDKMRISTADGGLYVSSKVVLTIPPQLVNSQIQFTPDLPDHMKQLLSSVQTWMEGAIKFVLEYPEPFWRESGYSGMLYSHCGIIAEMYDHTNFEESKFGFTGFLSGGAASYSQETRKEFVLGQLVELMGEKASNPSSYSDKIWTDEFISAGSQLIQRPHQNNGHPSLHESYCKGKLFFGGTETSTEYSGYMEGAILSALNVSQKF